ncbi:chromodomain Y-like protein isoform X3 [Salvelinus fontinalis]|uniref:chromodomain Y-like protein isoform X3 n=1 Tax=Salvelinus fontinalis TaxID=8038 RepID=UPI0024858FAE|nr:chromodomain Y-like protein isoform X3 [Salvelinus fontinalis]
MASEELYEPASASPLSASPLVERIVDKRKNKKGKIEYLVRWRGYGYEGDTWEPETHLSACVEFIHDFNRQHGERQRDSTLLRSTRSTPSTTHSHSSRNNARKQICRPQPPSGAGSHALVKHGNDSSPTTAATAISKQLPPLDAGVAHTRTNMQLNLSQKYSVSATGDICRPGFTSGPAASPVGTVRRSMDLAKSGIKILVPKSPMSSRADSESSPSEAAHCLEQGGQEQDSVPPEVALLEKPPGLLLGPGEERARMGTRPRTQSPLIPQQVPITPASIRTLNGKGTSTLMEALAANGTGSLQSAVAGVTAVSGVAGKRRFEEQRSVFDKRLRFSVRQTESAYRYRDLVVKKQDGFTHILLSTKSSENNSLNPDVMKEMQSAMATAAADDSKLVLLSAVGSIFCFGLDFIYFIRRLTDDRKKESIKMAETIRTFVNTFIQFKKPIIVAVNGPAVGLGASILPLCDVVWANEKSWFQTPYTTYGQTPDACASLTFPRIMGVASANEMLLSGRKLTAQEACAKGLVSQVLWPGTFTQEVLRESKALVRNANRAALEQANERECEALKRVWGSSQGVDSILKYLQKKIDEF